MKRSPRLIAGAITPHLRPEPRGRVPGSTSMQYLIYFAVATPLVLAGLLWASAVTPPQPPMFHSFAETVHDRAVLAREAAEMRQAKEAALAHGKRAPAQAKRAAARIETKTRLPSAKPHLEHTARADDHIKLR
jgi:hypothetical protein